MKSLLLSVCFFFSINAFAAEESHSHQLSKRLFAAIATSNLEDVRACLEEDMNSRLENPFSLFEEEVIHRTNEGGDSPLTFAVGMCHFIFEGHRVVGCAGNMAIVELLLFHGALPQLADANGWTALELAISLGNVDLVSLLRSFRRLDLNLASEAPELLNLTPRDLMGQDDRLRFGGPSF